MLTIVILIFAEVTPKTFAALYPDKIAYPVSWIVYPLMKLFSPLVLIINLIAKVLLRIFGINPENVNQELLTKDECDFDNPDYYLVLNLQDMLSREHF